MTNRKTLEVKNLLFGTQNIAVLLPGVILAVAVMLLSIFLTKAFGDFLHWQKNPLSPILIAIILGLTIRSTIPLPKSFIAGIEFGLKKILRFGIILMGIRAGSL